ncbi:MAG: hypothetical protein LBG60_16125 [Bifidobacteriaceae bacterium]|nr:hypothetical protein [Bifidobacteriaceae bacterium]
MPIPLVVLMTDDPGLADAASAAIWEAGAAVQPLDSADQIGHLAAVPRLAVCGHDVDQAAAAGLARAWPSCQIVRAALGDRGPGSGRRLVLPESARQLTALVERVHRPVRPVIRVALIGAHGGAGTSCLAVALALWLAGDGGPRGRSWGRGHLPGAGAPNAINPAARAGGGPGGGLGVVMPDAVEPGAVWGAGLGVSGSGVGWPDAVGRAPLGRAARAGAGTFRGGPAPSQCGWPG